MFMSAPHYTPEFMGRVLKMSAGSIRDWSSKFEDYLSASANPGKGKARRYTEEDAEFFKWVKMQRYNGRKIEEIERLAAEGAHMAYEGVSGELQHDPASGATEAEIERLRANLEAAEETIAEQRELIKFLKEQIEFSRTLLEKLIN